MVSLGTVVVVAVALRAAVAGAAFGVRVFATYLYICMRVQHAKRVWQGQKQGQGQRQRQGQGQTQGQGQRQRQGLAPLAGIWARAARHLRVLSALSLLEF